MYVHHDILLSSFPIALEWLAVQPSSFQSENYQRANVAVVGTFLPDIELWNLDILDTVEPSLILEGFGPQSIVTTFGSKQKKKVGQAQGHCAGITSLSLNSIQKNLLCSGSADGTVKLWDLGSAAVVTTHECSGFKPDVVAWHPQDQSVLLVATDENVLRAADIRAPKEIGTINIGVSVEGLTFDSANLQEIHLALSNGCLAGVDLRKGLELSYRKKVCEKAVSSVGAHPKFEGLLTSTGMDSVMVAWDSRERDEKNCPKIIDRMLTQGGKLFNGSFYSDAECLFGCGSSSGEVILWAMDGSKKVREAFGVTEQIMITQ